MTAPPTYLTIWPDGEPSVDIPSKSRFTWRPAAKELAVDAKATPELLSELAETGFIDGMRTLKVSEWSKALPTLPALPKPVAASIEEVHIGSSKFGDWNELYRLPGLQRLVIGEKVSVVPDGIGALKTLTHLDIRGKRLKELPADLDALTSLEVLLIVSCPITTLPERLGELPLTRLRLSWTKKIKSLPESIGASTTLRCLETVQAPLKALPSLVYTSETLEELSIEDAKLSKLGPKIACPSLRILSLSGTFKKWPAEVTLPKLEEISVSNEKITTLPDVYHPGLKHVASHAPLTSIDPRFASIEPWFRGRARMGVSLSATETAIAALGEEERAAFGGRLKLWR